MAPRLVVVASLVTLAGCARSGAPPASAKLPPAEQKSVQLIVEAVDEHDRRCALPVTPPRGRRVASELGITECATDVDSVELGACLREIETEPCNAPATTRFELIPECRLGALCTTVEEGTL